MTEPHKQGESAYVFGYGSLVNRRTWPNPLNSKPASVAGWIRQWRHKIPLPHGDVCGLTIVPCAEVEIAGLIVRLGEPWDSLDNREIGYRRICLPADDLRWKNGDHHGDQDAMGNLHTYTSEKESLIWANEEQPIIKTYIDTIAEGYYNVYGIDGLNDFFSSTQGWDLPIMDDRDQPLYPRALEFEQSFLELVDAKIEDARKAGSI